MNQTIFSKWSITPQEVVAGDSVEFILHLEIGSDYPDQPTRLVFDCQGMLGTSCPNRQLNEESGYTEVYASNPAVEYTTSFWNPDKKKFADDRKPTPVEGQRMIVVDLSAGLETGDTVSVHWGDAFGGFGPGTKVTTVVPRPDFSSWVDVRFFANQEQGIPDYAHNCKGYKRPVPDVQLRLSYAVKPRSLHHLRLIRQHDCARLIPYDRYWNVQPKTALSDLVETSATAQRNAQGVHTFAAPHVKVKSKTLPLSQSAPMDDVLDGYNLYWGELHNHSMYSIDCSTRSAMDMSPADLMVFARDRAALDFYAVTDHHDPDYVEAERVLASETWENTMAAVERHHEPGRFVTFAGFEKATARGEAVVIFKEEQPYDVIADCGTAHFPDIWEHFAGQDYLTIPHFHNDGRLEKGTWQAPKTTDLEPVLEIYSDHGSFEREYQTENGPAQCKRPYRYDRSAEFFLQNGYHYGFVANSDDHKGHVGVNGLTAVFAKELTRDSIFEAYRARRVYATTNARIRLIVTANGHPMGSILPNTATKQLHLDVVAEGPIKKIDVFRNGRHWQRYSPTGLHFQQDLTINDSEPSNWYVRVTQQNHQIAWSSPIWFEEDAPCPT